MDAITASLTAVRPRSPSPETTRCAHRDIRAALSVAELEREPPPKSSRDKTSEDHAMHDPTGQRMARDFDRQVAEIQVRIAITTGYTAQGIPAAKAVG